MAETPNMEIPEAVRQMAEQNLEQARNAYDQFMGMVSKAQEMATHSSGTMTESAMEIQKRSMKFTEQNMQASFSLAADLAKARNMKEYFEIQSRHAQRQMQTYTHQAQELGLLISQAANKAQS